ncbi:hypothetical protein LWI28_008283 [Acer negundo]|uniref:RNase H type-1 domain-containing protein n=1 Tax=Acer negundo TaxID=4023 RepID=A0AAD5NTD0_ACENE|nr:hypothetical protein LWI28_008283 [Acer negundo]
MLGPILAPPPAAGRPTVPSPVWSPPSHDLYKINCDAAIDSTGYLVGCGAVIRNSNGLVMTASSQQLVATFLPHVAEAYAILCGLQLAIDSGLFPVTVESDAAVVVNWINEGLVPISEVGVFISDIKNLLQQIQFIAVSFVPRLANTVAHCLAKFALSCGEEYPPCISLIVQAEAQTCL